MSKSPWLIALIIAPLSSCVSDKGRFTLYVENDAFGYGSQSDSNYTHGTQFEWVEPIGSAPSMAKWLKDTWLFKPLNEGGRRESLPELFSDALCGNIPVGTSRVQEEYVKLASAILNAEQSNGLPLAFYHLGQLTALEGLDKDDTAVQALVDLVVEHHGVQNKSEQLKRQFGRGFSYGSFLPGALIKPNQPELYSRLRVGQQIYTPNDISQSNLIVDDRPYAGWAYVSLDLVQEKLDTRAQDLRRDRQRAIGLTLGLVGPDSGAGSVQRRFHRLGGFTTPEGWHNQLDNEVGLIVSAEQKDRFAKWKLPNGWELDAISNVGVRIGNVFTMANFGTTVRIGPELNRSLGADIIPTKTGEDYKNSTRWFNWHVFTGVDGRLVGRDIFLDGNTFSSSHSVDSELLVADLKLGATLKLRNCELSFTLLHRTEEFDGQDGPQVLGAWSLRIL